MPDPQQVMERLRRAERQLGGTMPTMVGAWLSGTDIPEALRDALTALSEAQERVDQLSVANDVLGKLAGEAEAELSRLRAENEELKAAFRQALRGSR